MIGPVSHDPEQLKAELLGTSSPVILDTETTGLDVLRDRVLSYGVRVLTSDGWVNFVLFTERCVDLGIQRYTQPDHVIADSLTGLSRADLVVVGHNLKYDLAMLAREGIAVGARTRDTLVLMRLLDQDRGFSGDTRGRRFLGAPPERYWTDYRLKNLGAHLLGIKPLYTPSENMLTVGYRTHVGYLAHDLFVTHRLYRHLWAMAPAKMQAYYDRVQSPLLSLLLQMQLRGVQADQDFAKGLAADSQHLQRHLSNQHQKLYALPLVGLTDDGFQALVYDVNRLPESFGRTKRPLRDDVLARFQQTAPSPQVRDSIRLVREFRMLSSLVKRVMDTAKQASSDGRLHSRFDNKQASGRISSTGPNLQSLAKPRVLLEGDPLEYTVRSRNLLRATRGHLLVAADVAQADVRVLAHEIDRCVESTDEHRRRLLRERRGRLRGLASILDRLEGHKNRFWQVASPAAPPAFSPNRKSRLVENFLSSGGDFYTVVASEVTGQPITRSSPERSAYKTILLAQINGESAVGLSGRLDCSKQDAEALIAKFFRAYPDIESWLALQRQQVALAGETYTWAGRYRRNTAHYWMVNEPRVRLLLTFKKGSKRWRYWFDVSPIVPGRHVLTCFVHRVWCVADERGDRPATLIYRDGKRLGNRPYPHLDVPVRYVLPYRNIAWRSIRRVQRLNGVGEPVEMANYEGLDTTCRALINSVMQGGTLDMLVGMMRQTQSLCQECGAHLLLNIHDELVFEVPVELLDRFLRGLAVICSQPPDGSWRVPIVLEAKVGQRFGELTQVKL